MRYREILQDALKDVNLTKLRSPEKITILDQIPGLEALEIKAFIQQG